MRCSSLPVCSAGFPRTRREMVAVDRLGFRLRIRSGAELTARRIAFPRRVTSLGAARTTLIAMLADCRAPGGG